MLTKDDLTAIKKILAPIEADLEQVKGQTALIPALNQKAERLERSSRKIQRDLDLVIRSFDREYLQLRARIDRIEEHLKLQRKFD